MSNKRSLLIRVCAVVVLILIAVCMMVIGRGHTVYLDNKAFEYEGKTYEAPYKVTVEVGGETVAKLYEKERGSANNIGQSFEMTLRIMQTKGGAETSETYRVKLPYNLDGVVINVPAFVADLPQEVYMSKFVSLIPEDSSAEEEVPGADEFDMGEDF